MNYRFSFMKPLGEELAQIAILAVNSAIKPVVTSIFLLSSVNLLLSILSQDEPEERSSLV